MNALVIDGITKIYNGKKVLDNVSLEVKQGEILGLLGPNGAGKTTLMKIVSGLSIATTGNVEIFGTDKKQADKKALMSRIGIVPQGNNLEREATVKEALILYAKLFKVQNAKEKVDELIKEFDMESWQDTKTWYLSGGMARKTMIVRALIPEPELLLLDEPSVGLDPDVRRDVWSIIEKLKNLGKTAILTTHYMEEADFLCDRIALLKAGRILCVDTAEALKKLVGHGEQVTLEDAFLSLIKMEIA